MDERNRFPLLEHGGLKYYIYILDWIARESNPRKIEAPEKMAQFLKEEETKPRLWSDFLKSFPYHLTTLIANSTDGFETTPAFNTAFKRVVENLELGLHPAVILSGFRDHKFSKELETLAPDTLFHFIPREHILSCLQKRVLFPSMANVFEYHFEEESAEDFDLLKNAFLETQGILSQADLDDELEDFIAIAPTPIFSCFTAIPKRNLSFHISHYGCMGIGFKRDHLIEKYKESSSSKFAPVRYMQTGNRVVLKALYSAYRNAKTESERKDILSELLLFKVLPALDFKRGSFYSSYFEYEWRYISSERPFAFDYSDIASIVVDKPTYELHTQRDFNSLSPIRWIAEIFNISAKIGVKIIPYDPFDTQASSNGETLRQRDLSIEEKFFPSKRPRIPHPPENEI